MICYLKWFVTLVSLLYYTSAPPCVFCFFLTGNPHAALSSNVLNRCKQKQGKFVFLACFSESVNLQLTNQKKKQKTSHFLPNSNRSDIERTMNFLNSWITDYETSQRIKAQHIFSSVFSEFAQSRFDSTCQPSLQTVERVDDNNFNNHQFVAEQASQDNYNHIAQSSTTFFTQQPQQQQLYPIPTDPNRVQLSANNTFSSFSTNDSSTKNQKNVDNKDNNVPTSVRAPVAFPDVNSQPAANPQCKKTVENKTCGSHDDDDDDDLSHSLSSMSLSSTPTPPCASQQQQQQQTQDTVAEKGKLQVGNEEEKEEKEATDLSEHTGGLPFEYSDIILRNDNLYLYKDRHENNNSLCMYRDRGTREKSTKHPVSEQLCVPCIFMVDPNDWDAMSRVQRHWDVLHRYVKCEKHTLGQYD